MSKASEYAARRPADWHASHEKLGSIATAWVIADKDGQPSLFLCTTGGAYPAADALSLGRWLIDTFGEAAP